MNDGAMSPMSGMQSMMPGGVGGGGMMSPNMMQSGMVGMMHGGHGMQVGVTIMMKMMIVTALM